MAAAYATDSEGAAQRFTVLLTACVAPKPGVREGLVRTDPALRLHDYQDGLAFWLGVKSEQIGGIVFAENSGYPLAGLQQWAAPRARADRPIEFLSFDMPPTPDGLNYGYSEFALIGEALRASRLLATTARFIKATGRYTFPDIDRLLRCLPDDFLIAADSKGMRPFGRPSHPITSVALALFDREFFKNQLSALHTTMVPAPPWNRRQYIEMVLFDHLYVRRTDPRIVLRWPCNCEPAGYGSNGDDYRSPRKRLQHAGRAVARFVAPALWI